MAKQARSVLLFATAFALAAAVAVAASRSSADQLTVHEWGTFTSVAGPDGQSVDWTPLSGPDDLPCFVDRQRPDNPGLVKVQVKGRDIFGMLKILGTKATLAAPGAPAVPFAAFVPAPRPAPPLLPPAFLPAKIRMETPVLYFYAPSEVEVSVKVAFQQGVMSEWYPQATASRLDLSRPLATTTGTIEWPVVGVVPGANVPFPHNGVKESHYYAAREVDAAPVKVGTQYEKFLFYRGLADFQPPIAATINRKGDVTVTGTSATPRVVLFVNRGGRVGYRMASGARSSITMSKPALNGRLDALRADLEAMLIEEGLYPREAKAMVATWKDSWFEEGTRIFYIIPKAAVDERLPLTISPAPAEVARVFVGRLELITPDMRDGVERAIVENDLDALSTYGRFLDSILLQIADRPSIAGNPARAVNAARAVATSRPQPAACQ